MNHPGFFDRAQAVPGVTAVALALLILTLIGIFAARPLTRTLGRAVGFIALLLGCTLTWWLVDGPLEGRTLITISPTHGCTCGDTLGLPALAVSAALLLMASRPGPALPPRSSLG
jgi:hypothetical protein